MADKLAEVKARFDQEGVSISGWAKENGFNVLTVYRLLSGRVQGRRGEAHRIAVALGVKDEPKELRFRTLAVR